MIDDLRIRFTANGAELCVGHETYWIPTRAGERLREIIDGLHDEIDAAVQEKVAARREERQRLIDTTEEDMQTLVNDLQAAKDALAAVIEGGAQSSASMNTLRKKLEAAYEMADGIHSMLVLEREL